MIITATEKLRSKLIRLGWLDYKGNNMRWFDWQKPGHDQQFQEPREPKAGKKKFVKKVRE